MPDQGTPRSRSEVLRRIGLGLQAELARTLSEPLTAAMSRALQRLARLRSPDRPDR